MPLLPVVFDVRLDPELGEVEPHVHRRLADVVERLARRWIEIDPQFVGPLRAVSAVLPDVQSEHALVRRPQHVRQVRHDERPRGGAVDRLHHRRRQPLRRRLRDPLLVEALAVDTVGVALEQHRPVVDPPHQRRADGDVVVGEVELGQAGLGEQHLLGAGDLDRMAVDDELDRLAELVALGHPRNGSREPPSPVIDGAYARVA